MRSSAQCAPPRTTGATLSWIRRRHTRCSLRVEGLIDGAKRLSAYIVEVLAPIDPRRTNGRDDVARLGDAGREHRVMETARALCAAYVEDENDIESRVDAFEQALEALRPEHE